MNALSQLSQLPEAEKQARGLVHTPGEIAQQPTTWRSTLEVFRGRQTEISEFLQASGLGIEVQDRPTVVLVGAGTSDYVGKSLTQLLRKSWQCEVLAIPSTDLLTRADRQLLASKRYLWISFSRSGDSPEGVAVLARALENFPEIAHLVVCCNRDGQMVRLVKQFQNCLAITLDDSVNDRGLAMTSSFSNMVVFGHCLAHFANPEAYEAVLENLISAGTDLLGPAAETAHAMANGDYAQAFFVGSGPLRAVAQESALKMLEMSAGKIRTMSESTLGLRHGPMAALNDETLLVNFSSNDLAGRKYDMDLLHEIGRKRLVKTRIAVSSGLDFQSGDFAEYFLKTAAEVDDDYLPPVSVMFGQLLGLFFSLACGLRPDSPSPNGAISRVVENVSVYS
ncbi:MAG: D-galactosamine 6-phosphate deaminase/isomerase [Acidobacteriaceae bacterium]